MIGLEPQLADLLRNVPQFKQRVWFDREMDQLVYLREDVSFRADRVDPFLTLLLHPYEDRLVGVKVKGLQAVFDVLVKNAGHADDDVMPLVDVITWAMTGAAFSELAKVGAGRRDEWLKKYELAKAAADDFEMPTDLSKIALAS